MAARTNELTNTQDASPVADVTFQVPKRLRLSDQLYEQILKQIVSGSLPEGQRLPPESELCNLFNVSRPVVREALFRLQADGLVSTKKGSGTVVRRRPDSAVFMLAPDDASIADVLRCFEFRIALEGEAAFLAAERRTSADLVSIRKSLKELDENIKEKKLGTEADLYFHMAIIKASGNHFFERVLYMFFGITGHGLNMTRSLSISKNMDRVLLVQREHIAIVDAITRKNSNDARSLMRTHIDNARNRLVSNPL